MTESEDEIHHNIQLSQSESENEETEEKIEKIECEDCGEMFA